MMNRKFLKSISLVFLISILINILPMKVYGVVKPGDTLGGLKAQLKDLQNKKKQNENKKTQTKEEIEANKNNIINTEDELETTKSEMNSLENEIIRMNEDIKNVKEESEDILRLYQKLESENVYVSYVTGASSMTEMIMRLDAVSQIIDHNQEKLEELELLINTNEKLNKKLDEYQVTLEDKIVAYEKSIENLDNELNTLIEGTLSIDEEIEALEETIKGYENLGCKDDQDLIECANVVNNTGWLKPVTRARVTSLYGKRSKPTANASSFHKGIDIGLSEGTKVYAIASGTVGAIVRKASCGGNMVYVWSYVNGKPYTYVFMHLLDINVKVGDKVGVYTVLGRSGGGSTSTSRGGYDKCTSGAHLHVGISEGNFYGSSKEIPLSKFNSYTINPPGYPGLYQWFYSR